MLDLNQRPPPYKGGKSCYQVLQAFAKPAYLSRFLFYGLLRVAGCCAPGGVRVVSKTGRVRPAPVAARLQHLSLLTTACGEVAAVVSGNSPSRQKPAIG